MQYGNSAMALQVYCMGNETMKHDGIYIHIHSTASATEG